MMRKVNELLMEEVIRKLRKLPNEKIREVLDFAKFIEYQDKKQQWNEFDDWAMNLAKKKGFEHLTYDNVADIVKKHRRKGKWNDKDKNSCSN